jgi:hypothetical protein
MGHRWLITDSSPDNYWERYHCRQCGETIMINLDQTASPGKLVKGKDGKWVTCEEKQAEQVHNS